MFELIETQTPHSWIDTIATFSLFILFVVSVAFISAFYAQSAKAQIKTESVQTLSEGQR